MKEFIRNLNIKECNECEEIGRLQEAHHINVAPLFWQGQGRPEIPLVIMGINPSVVGTANEPKREDDDFERYFNYYQDRNISEAKNIEQANQGGFNRRIPVGYWTRCYNLANYCIQGGTPRWENYVLMEIIHCFFNRARDLPLEEAKSVAKRCLDRYTKKMLIVLKPKKMILLGKPPYEVFEPYFEKQKAKNNYEFCALNLDGLRIPVLRHLHPCQPVSQKDGGFYRRDAYDAFKSYCNGFDYGA
jgi:hypothetical protein